VFNYRVRPAFEPGSFDDARTFAWSSISELIAQWWPLYGFCLVVAATAYIMRIEPAVRSIIMIVAVGTPIFVTCATRFRGTFPLTPSVINGVTLTFVVPTYAMHLFLSVPLLFSGSLRATAFIVLLIIGVWFAPKLYGAGCFYLLGAGKFTPLECIGLSWRFFTGERWRTQFAIVLVAVFVATAVIIALALVAFTLRLGVLAYVLGAALGVPLNLFCSTATMRIVSTAPELYGRYWEASKNSAE
jgi:hypothetical protein